MNASNSATLYTLSASLSPVIVDGKIQPFNEPALRNAILNLLHHHLGEDFKVCFFQCDNSTEDKALLVPLNHIEGSVWSWGDFSYTISLRSFLRALQLEGLPVHPLELPELFTLLKPLNLIPHSQDFAYCCLVPIYASAASHQPMGLALVGHVAPISTPDANAQENPTENATQHSVPLLQLIFPFIYTFNRHYQLTHRNQWLSLSNAILAISNKQFNDNQNFEQHLHQALAQVMSITAAQGAMLVEIQIKPNTLSNSTMHPTLQCLATAGRWKSKEMMPLLDDFLYKRISDGEIVHIPRYDLLSQVGRHPTECGDIKGVLALSSEDQGFGSLALVLVHSEDSWKPTAGVFEGLGDVIAAFAILRNENLLQHELRWAAHTDSLTGLGNRRAFERSTSYFSEPHALLMMDLDNFKAINDTYGHVHADRLLTRVGAVIQTNLRKNDKAFRLGGDEFAILAKVNNEAELPKCVERFRRALEELYVAAEVPLKVSIGCAMIDANTHFEEVWHQADQRLYSDKRNRKNASR